MERMQVNDYIKVTDIPTQEVLEQIRGIVKGWGYPVSSVCGTRLPSRDPQAWDLVLDSDGDLLWENRTSAPRGRRWFPTPGTGVTLIPCSSLQEISARLTALEQKVFMHPCETPEEVAPNSQKPSSPTYKVGQCFQIENEIYRLILVDSDRHEVCLVSKDLMRWSNSRSVNHYECITHKELDKLINPRISPRWVYPIIPTECEEVAPNPAPLPQTFAQQAGFEVGDLGVVTEETMFKVGSIIRLIEDDATEVPYWVLVEGDLAEDCCRNYDKIALNLGRVKKLHNVTLKEKKS